MVSLFQRILGDDFKLMPQQVQKLHSLQSRIVVNGVSRVIGGNNAISKAIRVFALLPKPIWRTPLTIDFIAEDQHERWVRNFGASRFCSVLKQEKQYLAEHLLPMPIVFVYDVKASRRGFELKLMGVRFMGLPLPSFLWPNLKSRTDVWKGRYRFCSRVGFWFCGWVITYSGYIDQIDEVPTTQNKLNKIK